MKRHRIEILLAAIWCIVLGTVDFNREWVFQLSKWFLCSVACLTLWRAWKEGKRESLIPLAAVAVVFNPIRPIEFLEREWQVVDWIAAFIWIAYWPNIRIGISKIRSWWQKTDPIGLGFGLLLLFGATYVGFQVYEEKKNPKPIKPVLTKDQEMMKNAMESMGTNRLQTEGRIGSYGYKRADGSTVKPGEGHR